MSGCTCKGDSTQTGSGLVVTTKPLHRIRRITVCLPARPRLLTNKKIGSVWELTLEMFPCSAQCLVRRSVHIHASIYGVFSVSSRNGLEPCSFTALARVFNGTGNHGNPANQLPPLKDERVDMVQEEPNVQPEFYLRGETDGMRSPWNVTLRRKHCLKLSFLAWF